MSERIRRTELVHYDTDIGSDVDDALALAYLAKSPEVTLSGVSTVFGPVNDRTNAARTLLEHLDMGYVLVATGKSLPLSRTAVVWSTQREGHLTNSYSNSDVSTNQLIPQNEFTLLATGPLTNVAGLVEQNNVQEFCRRIVIMGGSLQPDEVIPAIENNFQGDPEAAAQIFNSDLPITLLPVDLTIRYPMNSEQEDLITSSQSPAGKLLGQWLTVWKTWSKENILPESPFSGTVYFHDPLAAAYITHPELFQTTTMKLSVSPDGSVVQGEKEVTVCTEVDEKIFTIIVDRLLS